MVCVRDSLQKPLQRCHFFFFGRMQSNLLNLVSGGTKFHTPLSYPSSILSPLKQWSPKQWHLHSGPVCINLTHPPAPPFPSPLHDLFSLFLSKSLSFAFTVTHSLTTLISLGPNILSCLPTFPYLLNTIMKWCTLVLAASVALVTASPIAPSFSISPNGPCSDVSLVHRISVPN